MQRHWRLLLLFLMTAGLAGCAVTGAGGSKAQITVENAFKSIQAGSAPVTLTALDPNGNLISVSWSLTYVNQACTPVCGSLAPTGASRAIYTPPSAPPTYGQATITVQSATDVWVGDIQITPATSVSISNKFSVQYAGGPQVTLTAVVLYNTASAGVAWSLTAGGSSCAPACGTITSGTGGPPFTAAYQPPTSVPSGANASPTISATSVTSSSASDSFSFTINSPSALLKGSYALLLRGYYLAGSPMALAGSITADGSGNITSGEFDIDNGGGITHIPSPTTGTYSIDLSFKGATRGRIVITSFKFPGSNIGLGFDFVLSADGKRGRAVELDGSAYINSGTFLQQDASTLAAANPAGTYAFALDSDAPVGGRIVEAGQFVLAAGGITGGLIDRSQAGAANPIYSGVQLDAGAVTSPDSSGRGTLTLSVPGESVHYAYYVVNSGQLNMIEIDNGATSGVQAGVAYAQKLPFGADTVNSTSVLQLTGMDAVPGTVNGIGPDVMIGVLKISGGSTFTLTFDENDLGKVLTKHLAGGTVSFDPATGRGVFSDPGGFESGFMDSAVFYTYDAGKAFVIDADISTCVTSGPCILPPNGPITNNAFSGTFTSQATGPFTMSSLNGNLIGGFGVSVIPDIPEIAAIVTADSSTGNFDILGDVDSLPSQNGNFQDYAFGGSYSITDQALGYGSATLPSFVFGEFSPPSNPPASFYMIGPNQFVLIGTQSGLDSGVSFVDPP